MKKFRKLLALVMAVCMVCMVSATAWAGEDCSAQDGESSISQGSSSSSKAKFEEHIASMDPELAQLILQDEELVHMMQQDYYWEPQPMVSSPRYVYLPLAEYPNGSYYTVNGRACTCNALGCTDVIKEGGNTNRCELYGEPGNCKRYTFTGAIQCKGFADYVYKLYSGKDISSSKEVDGVANISTSDGAKFKEYFNALPMGSNVRVQVRGENYKHSFIINAISPAGVSIYDCNSDGKCKVVYKSISWDTLAQKYSAIIKAWKS